MTMTTTMTATQDSGCQQRCLLASAQVLLRLPEPGSLESECQERRRHGARTTRAVIRSSQQSAHDISGRSQYPQKLYFVRKMQRSLKCVRSVNLVNSVRLIRLIFGITLYLLLYLGLTEHVSTH